MNARSLLRITPVALLFVLGAARATAQTTFTPTSTFANFATGAAVHDSGTGLGGIVSNGSSYAVTGPTSGSFTGETFGQSFTVTANGTSTQGGTAAWGFDGNIGGAAVTAGATLPISFDFDITTSAGITSPVTWSVYFRGGSFALNGEHLIATGVTSGSSSSITGSGSYTFTTGATTSENYRAYIEVSFTSNVAISPGTINVTMANTGFGGEGITLGVSAIPEPSTYAAIAGTAMLGLAIWRRRSRTGASTTELATIAG
jgi:hypothetical protein